MKRKTSFIKSVIEATRTTEVVLPWSRRVEKPRAA